MRTSLGLRFSGPGHGDNRRGQTSDNSAHFSSGESGDGGDGAVKMTWSGVGFGSISTSNIEISEIWDTYINKI